MPKINQEEYEKIKLLPDYDWNWIAREKTGKILSFTNKPAKTDEVWKDRQTRLWFNYKDSQLFQFIQWEDEEPYNIQELIEEYEKDYKGSWEHAIEFSKEMRSESEETEVNKQKLIEKWESAIEAAEFYGRGKEDRLIEYMRNFVDDLNQLDEPEVLSEEWIDRHTYYEDEYDFYYADPDELKNLLVPKQEEVDHAYRKGFKEGERQTAEYFESITEEPSKEQVWKYLSEHGIEVVDEEPETVASVIADFYKSLERFKEVLGTKVEELEE